MPEEQQQSGAALHRGSAAPTSLGSGNNCRSDGPEARASRKSHLPRGNGSIVSHPGQVDHNKDKSSKPPPPPPPPKRPNVTTASSAASSTRTATTTTTSATKDAKKPNSTASTRMTTTTSATAAKKAKDAKKPSNSTTKNVYANVEKVNASVTVCRPPPPRERTDGLPLEQVLAQRRARLFSFPSRKATAAAADSGTMTMAAASGNSNNPAVAQTRALASGGRKSGSPPTFHPAVQKKTPSRSPVSAALLEHQASSRRKTSTTAPPPPPRGPSVQQKTPCLPRASAAPIERRASSHQKASSTVPPRPPLQSRQPPPSRTTNAEENALMTEDEKMAFLEKEEKKAEVILAAREFALKDKDEEEAKPIPFTIEQEKMMAFLAEEEKKADVILAAGKIASTAVPGQAPARGKGPPPPKIANMARGAPGSRGGQKSRSKGLPPPPFCPSVQKKTPPSPPRVSAALIAQRESSPQKTSFTVPPRPPLQSRQPSPLRWLSTVSLVRCLLVFLALLLAFILFQPMSQEDDKATTRGGKRDVPVLATGEQFVAYLQRAMGLNKMPVI